MSTRGALMRIHGDRLTRRGLLTLLAAPPLAPARRARAATEPATPGVHGQLLELARRQQDRRRARFAAVRDRATLAALRDELRAALLGALGGLPRPAGP